MSLKQKRRPVLAALVSAVVTLGILSIAAGPQYDDAGGGAPALPLTGGTVTAETILAEGFEATGDYDTACTAGSMIYDSWGALACPPATDAVPSVASYYGHSAYFGATSNTTGGNLRLCPGLGRRIIAITNSNCGAADTVTVTIDGTAAVCTRDAALDDSTHFTCGASNAANATNIAACLSAQTGVSATANSPTSGTVYVTRELTEDPPACYFSLATNDATMAAITSGVDGGVYIGTPGAAAAPALQFATLGATAGFYSGGASDFRFGLSGSQVWASTSSFGLNVSSLKTTSNVQNDSNHVKSSSTNPSVASGFSGSAPTCSVCEDTDSFAITINATPSGTGVITLPTATNGWVCRATDITSDASVVVSQTAYTTTSATFAAYSRTLGTGVNFVQSDVVTFSCKGL